MKISSKNAFAWMVAGLALFAAQPALAEVVRDDAPQIEGLTHSRVYEWQDRDIKPKAVAIAVHGLVLHGGVYDKMARELASQGFIVVAPDLRGYGRWCRAHEKRNKHGCTVSLDSATVSPVQGLPAEVRAEKCSDCNNQFVSSSSVSYKKSFGDLKELTRVVRNHYPALPLYVIGESLGAGLALHMAAEMPDSIDGLVLSSPAIKRRLYMEPRMVMDLTVLMFSPKKNVDLIPYIKRFASEDPTIIQTAIQDPLVRKKLTVFDLLRTSALIKSNIKFADRVPENMPVLVIQGDRDRMLNSNGVVVLLDHLKSKDQTVKWFPGKGHLLLETPHIEAATMDIVSNWLTEHVSAATLTKASAINSDLVKTTAN
ncbi:MAG: alpha/beta fold hydrolase [Candidatus Melainabacteria bacterium]|nr:alpha/beta fold hydrolase [Candidatus Melainabacteria bacterium]